MPPELYAGYYRTPRKIDDTISLVGLADKADTLAGELSGGQRRRLDVGVLALIGDPDIVFLDEPTTGFDPSARRAAWDVIAGLRQLGKTIFLTTHYMDEAEYLADRIAVMADGRIVAEGTPKTLGGRDRMTAAIRFTLRVRHDRARPAGRCAPPRRGPGRRADRRAQREPARARADAGRLGRSGEVSTFPTSTSVARPSKTST